MEERGEGKEDELKWRCEVVKERKKGQIYVQKLQEKREANKLLSLCKERWDIFT